MGRCHSRAIHRQPLSSADTQRYQHWVTVLRPFLGVRYATPRASLARVLAPRGEQPDQATMLDPRHAHHLQGRRGAILAAEWLRAGVLLVDDMPSVTVVAVDDRPLEVVAVVDDNEDEDLLPARMLDPSWAIEPHQPQAWPWCQSEPVELGYQDSSGRVQRLLRNETERDADVTIDVDGVAIQAWSIDDESSIARVLTLIEAMPLSLLHVPAHHLPGTTRVPTLCRLFPDDGAGGVERTQEARQAWPVGLVMHRPFWRTKVGR
jgi:hypothetical protein